MKQEKRERGQSEISLSESISRYYLLYLMAIPGVVFFVMFYLVPISGIVIAWQDYNIFKGVFGSPWVGWKHFAKMFRYAAFLQILSNTIMIGLWILLAGFPVPVILALLLNEINVKWYKRVSQTLFFLPRLTTKVSNLLTEVF